MAATFPSSPEPKKARLLPCSPAPEKAGLFPGWVLLDRSGRAHCYDDPDAAASAVGDDATAVAVHTNNGQSGYLAFTLRAPPLVSYIDLHWPYGMPQSMFHLPAEPFVLSADENHVLLRVALLKESREGPNFFVYTAGASSSPPSLRRLPACTKTPQGLAGRSVFMVMDTDMGILCRGGGQDDYVVADLIVSWKKAPVEDDYIKPSQVIASLCVFSSREGEWTVKEMPAPQPHGQGDGDGEFPVLWNSDRVLPFAGRFLCWIDYYSGILLCDLSNGKSPLLYYKPFPGKQYPDEERLNRGWPELYRNMSASQGMMRFVDIDKERGNTITVWNFGIAGTSFTWEMQNVINLSDLWAQQAYQVGHLPCRAPEFPVVAKNDTDVLYCILRENELFQPGKVWIIIIDMKHGTFRSGFRYFDEQIVCCKEDLDMDCESFFCIAPLLPAEFSMYLNSPSGGHASFKKK